MTDYIRPPKYPAYKEARDAAEFQQNGNIILPIESLLRETRLMLHAEGYVELTDAEITVFIDLSCSDAIAMNSKLNGPISVAGIEYLASLRPDIEWVGHTSWLTDWFEMLMVTVFKRHPFGIWEVSVRYDALIIRKMGDYTEMLYEYLKSIEALPTEDVVLAHWICR